MVKKWMSLAAGLAMSLYATASVADEMVGVKAAYFQLSPSGIVSADALGLPGTTINLESTLGLERDNNVMFEALFQLGNHRLTGSYIPFQSSGNGTVSVPFTFNGTTFNVGAQTSSDLDAKLYGLHYTYFLLNFDDLPTRFQLGLDIGVTVADLQADIASVTPVALSTSASATAPIPTVGLRARVGLSDYFGIQGYAGAIAYAGNRYIEADVQAEFSPIPLVGIHAGYRLIDIDIDESGLLLDARFAGPYAGVFARF